MEPSITFAHDFKTAVLSIKEFAQILEQEHAEQLQSDGRFLISRILANVASLESMIQGILEYIRIGIPMNSEEEQKEHHQFYIEDNGVGILEENADRIFDIFRREERGVHVKGYGIGLAIVKKILEQAQCSVRVDSNTAGRTVFYFTLPRERASPGITMEG